MEWTKIPTDLLQSCISDKEILAITKYQLLWAMLERQPEDSICLRYMTAKQLQQARDYLSSIERRVNADIKSVDSHRKRQKMFYQKNQTLVEKTDGHTDGQYDGHTDGTDKIRLDNKKEIYKESFDRFWEEYPKQRAGSKLKAYQAYCKAIKEKRATEEQILESVQNYKTCDEVKRGYAKGCAAWLNDDRFNNEYVPKKEQSEMTEEELLAWGRG